MQTTQTHVLPPNLWQLFRTWSGIGLQSFGGGASTSFLIQQEFIEKHHWLTMEEYTHYWNLCMFAPGINLLALSILIGKKLGGAWGVTISLLGMLLPSAAVTCLLTAGFAQIEHLSAVAAVLKGVVPATAGIMFLVGLRFAQPQLKVARQEGSLNLIASLLLILGSALAISLFQLPVILVLPGTALLGLLLFTRWHQQKRDEAQ